MPKAKIYNEKAETIGEINLPDNIFAVKANMSLVHQAVIAQLANERQVLAHTKGRAEVRGGGRKPWKQKGTGRARQGSIRAPQWIGGGVVFGPLKTRNFSKNINKKMRQKAIFMALSDKAEEGNLLILEKLEMPEFKTKAFNGTMERAEKILAPEKSDKKNKKSKTKRSLLVINNKKDEKVKNSGRNLAGVKILNLDNINIVDLMKYKNLILTVDGVKKLEERYAINPKSKIQNLK